MRVPALLTQATPTAGSGMCTPIYMRPRYQPSSRDTGPCARETALWHNCQDGTLPNRLSGKTDWQEWRIGYSGTCVCNCPCICLVCTIVCLIVYLITCLNK